MMNANGFKSFRIIQVQNELDESSKSYSNDSTRTIDSDWLYKEKQLKQQILSQQHKMRQMQQRISYQNEVIHRLHVNFEYVQYHHRELQIEKDKKQFPFWKSSDSMNWILNLNADRFMKYEQALLTATVLDEISGPKLVKMNDANLKWIGIGDETDRSFLLKNINYLKSD